MSKNSVVLTDEHLRQVHDLYFNQINEVLEQLREGTSDLDPTSFHVFNVDAKGHMQLIDTLPQELKKFVMNGEFTEKFFDSMCEGLLCENSKKKKAFMDEHKQEPNLLVMVSHGERLVPIFGSVKPIYKECWIIAICSMDKKLVNGHFVNSKKQLEYSNTIKITPR